jgi:hypothetical protein
MKNETPEKKSVMLMVATMFGIAARYGFEWFAPIYSLFAFPWHVSLLIWVVFVFWQIPLSIYLIMNVSKKTEPPLTADLTIKK